MKKSAKFTIGVCVVLLIISIIVGASLLRNNQKPISKGPNSEQKTHNTSTSANSSDGVNAPSTDPGNDSKNNPTASSASAVEETVTTGQDSIVNSTENQSSNNAFDRTNQTDAARIAKEYYQSIGQDGPTLVYNGYQIENSPDYEVRVVDTELQKNGGSGTVDLLRVDNNNNVTRVNN